MVIARSFAGSRALTPLAYHNYRLLLAGQIISALGDAFFAVTLPWLMLTTGGGAQALGLLLACYGLPRMATTLLGGTLTDRLSPRQVMLAADCGRAALVGVLVVLMRTQGMVLWQFCALAVALGALSGIFLPAAGTMIPAILPDDILQAGNALWAVAMPVVGLVGPGLAGVALARLQTGELSLAVDALSYVVSALTLAAMRRPKPGSASASGIGLAHLSQATREYGAAGGGGRSFSTGAPRRSFRSRCCWSSCRIW